MVRTVPVPDTGADPHEIGARFDSELAAASTGDANSAIRTVPKAEQAEIEKALTVVDGREYHQLIVNGVRILPQLNLRYNQGAVQIIADITELCRANNLKNVMIADTAPSDEVVKLVSELNASGVQVHFADHHRTDYEGRSNGHKYLQNYDAIKVAVEESGGKFTGVGRDKAPSVACIIPPGSLVKDRIDLLITYPPDPDGLFAALRGAGLDPGLSTPGQLATSRALSVIDSPQHWRAYFGEFDKGHIELPDWLNEFQFIRGNIEQDPKKLVEALYAFAKCAKDRDIAGPAYDKIGEFRQEALTRRNVIRQLITNFYEEDGQIYTLNLSAIRAGRSLFPLTDVFQGAELNVAKELVGAGSSRLNPQELKGVVSEVVGTLGWDRAVLVTVHGCGSKAQITGIGAFSSSGRNAAAIDFVSLAKEVDPGAHGFAGFRGVVDLGSTPQEQERTLEKLNGAIKRAIAQAELRELAQKNETLQREIRALTRNRNED